VTDADIRRLTEHNDRTLHRYFCTNTAKKLHLPDTQTTDRQTAKEHTTQQYTDRHMHTYIRRLNAHNDSTVQKDCCRNNSKITATTKTDDRPTDCTGTQYTEIHTVTDAYIHTQTD